VSAIAPAAGESAGFADRLYVAHPDALLRYCRRRLGCPIEAEDAVQTTFLYATRALQRGVVPESESAWLHAIAKNVCRWQRRTDARRASVVSDPLAGPVAAEAAPDTDGELALEIREALARVPERQRQALVLREVQGLPSAEVATVLGLRPSETYALLARARRSFARAYALVTGRTSLGAQIGPVLLKLKSALLGGTATVVAATSIAGGVALGLGGAGAAGVAPERGSSRPSSGTDAVIGSARTVRTGDASADAPARAEARRRGAVRTGVLPRPGSTAEAERTRSAGPARDQTPPRRAGPTADAPAPVPERAPEPTQALPVPLPGVPLPIEEPDLGVDLPLEPPLPLPEAGDLLEPIVSDPPVLGEPLPEVPSVPGVTAPKLP
jgi:RNA polymerase sigma-70 factor, ECF subfamily